MSSPEFSIREATPDDASLVERLIFEHGPNEWNYLPKVGVKNHVARLAIGSVGAVLAETDGEVIGAVTYEVLNILYARYQPAGREHEAHGYVAEAVVHRDFAGQGVGSELLRAAIANLTQKGLREVYAKRHADNLPSGRMMEKSGMVIIDEFDDPEIRPTGSRRTTVTRFTLSG